MLALDELYDRLVRRYGQLHWWPAESPFEVCVGAILTQNTSWTNVEKAIANLKVAGVLSPHGIAGLGAERLAALIRPAGYFNVKARRLKDFVAFLMCVAQGDLGRLFSGDWQELRRSLLAVRGIGPETADSMLLYAGQRPSFVVDAYTRRLFSRLGLVDGTIAYGALRDYCMERLPADAELYNNYHALIVEHGKQVCRSRPRCGACCLADGCPSAQPAI